MISKEELEQLKELSLAQIEALPEEKRKAVWRELAKDLLKEADIIGKVADKIKGASE